MSDYEQFISDKATEINSMVASKRYDRICELLRAEWSEDDYVIARNVAEIENMVAGD